MKRFVDFEYRRPDRDAFEARMDDLVTRFASASSAGVQDGLMAEIDLERNGFESMVAIGRIRHTIDTADAFYDAENDAADELMPVYEGIKSRFYAALVSSRFRPDLERRRGPQLFRLAELQLSTFSPEVLGDLQAENRLASEYVKLKAGARIDFMGEVRNLPQMVPFIESKDRGVRRDATEAVSSFYSTHIEEFDGIYDKLVHLRDGIARRLGFPGFVPLAYARLGRSDYDAAMVAGYRGQVLGTIVPLAAALRKRQAARIGLTSLKFFDESFEFPSGNPVPGGGPSWILDRGRNLFSEMSPATKEFFDFMVERELMDLETRSGKAGGGYCSYIATEGAPFIFSNFNGTSGDVDVLTHEAGHAFQAYRSRGFEVPEYLSPTLEACEIHSMSMEFLAWPWMDRFFGGDADKYRFAHLSGAVLFIPYGAAVDEYQHRVYGNPSASPSERRAAWRGIERRYLPWRDYDGDSFLENGGFWFRQGHIFEDPFYYIDYTLAQVCAFEFWGRARAGRDTAMGAYTGLCDLGGSRSFTELLSATGLRNPFADGAVGATIGPVAAWLDSVEDGGL